MYYVFVYMIVTVLFYIKILDIEDIEEFKKFVFKDKFFVFVLALIWPIFIIVILLEMLLESIFKLFNK